MADSNTLQQASSKRNWLMNERNEWMKLQLFQGAGITDGAGIGRSRFLEMYSGFQNPGFPNPQEKKLDITDFTSKNSPDSGIRIPLVDYRCYFSVNISWVS